MSNQRARVRMSDAEIDAFLIERREATLCSILPDGGVHAVAMWYGFVDGAVGFATKSSSQKMRNLERDPRATVLVTDGTEYETLRGVELRGEIEVLAGDDARRLMASIHARNLAAAEEDAPDYEAMSHKRTFFRLRTSHVSSWDHAKLG